MPRGSHRGGAASAALRALRKRTRPMASARNNKIKGLTATANTKNKDCVAPVGKLSICEIPKAGNGP